MVCSHYLSPSPFPAKARDGDARPELEALIRVWGYGVEGLGFRCSGFRGLGFGVESFGFSDCVIFYGRYMARPLMQ